MPIAEDLDLDVARRGDVALEEHPVVAEGAGGLASRRGDGRVEVGRGADDAHALAPTAGGGLDDQGVADAVGIPGALGRGECGHPGGDGQAFRRQLVAHLGDDRSRGPDPGQPGTGDLRGEAGVLRQEPVAGVDGLRPAAQGGVDDGRTVQVPGGQPHRLVGFGHEGGVGVGVDEHGDGADAHRVGGADDAAGDLAAIGDQDRGEAHSRNTP